MKKLLLLQLLIVTLSVKAQTSIYHPFPDSNAIWSIHGQGCCNFNCPPPPSPVNVGLTDLDFSYFSSGDTIINSVSYHKLYKSGYGHEHCQFGNYVNNWFYFNNAYICSYRQDTLAKKVFTFFNSENLLYDFSLNVGDTVDNNCATITSIDSVLVGNNYRKRFNLSSVNYSLIEGIGSTSGLFEPLCPFEYFGTLLCFAQNGQTLYPDTNSVCEIITHVNEPEVKPSVSVYPNPFDLFTSFQTSKEFLNSELTIFSSLGIKVRQQYINDYSTIIYRDGLQDGIYFFQVINKKGKVMAGKFIIE